MTPETPVGKHVDLEMACSCQPEDLATLEAIADRVAAKVVSDVVTNKRATLITGIVYSLQQQFHAGIREVCSDMWARVTVATHERAADGKPTFSVSCECDQIEHGLAKIYEAFEKEFPDKMIKPLGETHERVSEGNKAQ